MADHGCIGCRQERSRKTLAWAAFPTEIQVHGRRRLFARSDNESDEDDARTDTSRASRAPAPTRGLRKRSAAEKSQKAVSKAFQSIVISSYDDDDDDDEEVSEEEAIPIAKLKMHCARRWSPRIPSSRSKH
ncbi:hypothetical protein BV20DRAFT_972324 [Pilatotrama ljubarskyi]|nr:hypothetical protein BV20DRAFT_972324 [Pilatotrama ljubarskyi]